MIQKTGTLLDIYQQQHGKGRQEALDALREGVEDEIKREDSPLFREPGPVREQLGPALSKMLRDKPTERFNEQREGAKGSRG